MGHHGPISSRRLFYAEWCKRDIECVEFCKWKVYGYMSTIGLHETIGHSFGRNYCVPCLNTLVLFQLQAFTAGSLNPRDQHSLFIRLAACLAYAFMSISITLFNKAVFSIYNFPFPAVVTTLQILVSLFYMIVLHHTKVLDLDITGLSFRTARQASTQPSTPLEVQSESLKA